MIKISIIAICFSLLFVMLAWFMLPKFLEQPKYKVVKKENNYLSMIIITSFRLRKPGVDGSL